MKSQSQNGLELRRILSAMVMDNTVCARISSQWGSNGLFDSKWADLVGGWCVNYFRKYKAPPKDHIQSIYEEWNNNARDETTAGVVFDFLEDLSNEYSTDESRSSEYILDRAGEYFNKVRLRKAMEEAEFEMDRGKVKSAHNLLQTLDKVELGEGALIKPAENYEAWRAAYDSEETEQLIHYPGIMDEFIGADMVRDNFVAFMGLDKSGKSMYLMDGAYRGVKNRKKVAYFECGDMSQNQVLRRLGQRSARKPNKPGVITLPTFIDHDDTIETKEKSFDEAVTAQEGFRAFRKRCRGKDLFRLSCHPNSSIDVPTISGIAQDWAREGWVADIIAIDYADILAAPPTTRDNLEEIDMTWRLLRRLAQEMHCLVLTATQAKASAYTMKGKVLRKEHFSGRKTKLAHVSGMIGIAVSNDDKQKGISKLNWVVKRDGYYNEDRYINVAGCYPICSPCSISE